MIEKMIQDLKKRGFNAMPHRHPRRDVFIKTQLGSVVITKTKLGFHVLIEAGPDNWTMNCQNTTQVLEYLDREFVRSDSQAITFDQLFPL